MKLSNDKFELMCISMLGLGQLFIMTGNDSLAFLLESVVHSINEREPDRIDAHAGYYGLAVLYFFYNLTCLFSPSFLYATSAKITLFISSVFFTTLPIGFLYMNKYYFYFSCALNGVGFALYYSGNGGYLTSHSSRKSIESNASLYWSLASTCMIVGSAIIFVITYYTAGRELPSVGVNSTALVEHENERRFSDNEIYLLFGVFTAVSVLGNIMFLLLPSRDSENCIESSQKTVAFSDGLHRMYRAMRSPKMIILIPMFLLIGVNTSFWVSIYPTTLIFNKSNRQLIYLQAFYSFGVGSGELLMGVLISQLSKRIKNFGLRPTFFIGCIFTLAYCFMVLLTTPISSPIHPTSEPPLLFQPTNGIVILIGILGGMGDCCTSSVRSVVCAINMPNRRDQAFAVSKFFQSFGTGIMFFLSPFLNLYYYVIGVPILYIIAGYCFYHESARIQKLEMAVTMEMEQKEQQKRAKEYKQFD
ncbi:unnamed protein product [Caenorhabditis bovis]|uniref:Uncharacterized protein n=1 Tax=Caenorhabditis bovis TaxID=2654633 RepID=A0A8S1E467_9PELO|nr:unnamed protein product [Caenorhabditis bovis]